MRKRGQHLKTAIVNLKVVLPNFLFGLRILCLLLLIKIGVEQTPIGKQMEATAYSYLMSSLGFDRTIPIVILDISQLAMKSMDRGDGQIRYTPRDKLKAIIQALANQGPTAIGVDVDFSPLTDDFVRPNEDPGFFDFCMQLKNPDQTTIPVFLGVFRQREFPMSYWLGADEYQQLAATIAIVGEPSEVVKRMPRWYEIPGSAQHGRTMCASLAAQLPDATVETYQSRTKHERGAWWSWAINSNPGRERDFLVDYSALPALISNRLRTIEPAVISDQGWRVRDNIVLIGDATCMGINDTGTEAEDAFLTPGFAAPVPGVYLHACGAYTLANRPLYELTWLGRLCLDVLLSVIILGIVTAVHLHYTARGEARRVNLHALEVLFTWLIACAMLIIGVAFVKFTRLMWDDFLIVIPLLLFHPSLSRIIRRVRRAIVPFWELITFAPEEEVEDVAAEEDKREEGS